MWRLFKEVLRSLRKNKVVVIGLSILVFLTSAIFTLLSSVKNVISGGFDNYKNVSKLHDVSVDLNLPNQGSPYNQGYYINGETSETLANDKKTSYSPIIYQVDESSFNKYKEIFNEYRYKEFNDLDSSLIDSYIKINELGINDPKYLDLFVKKDDLLKSYSVYKAEQQNHKEQTINFDLKSVENFNFSTQKPLKWQLYKFDGKNYQPVQDKIDVNVNAKFKTQNNIKLGDILTITNIDNVSYFSQISNLYANIKDNTITSDYKLGQFWINNDEGIVINANKIISALGLKRVSSNPHDSQYYSYVIGDKDKFLALVDVENIQQINEKTSLKNEFEFKQIFNENFSKSFNSYINLEANKKYNISPSWVSKTTLKTVFLRDNYYTSFVEGFGKEKWTGAFKTYMDSLGKIKVANRNEVWDELETFDYWRKNKIVVLKPYKRTVDGKWEIDENQYKTKTISLPLSSNFDFADLKTIKLWTDDPRVRPDGNKYKIDKNNSQNIIDIYSTNLYDRVAKKFNNLDDINKLQYLSNENILNERYSIINSRAYESTKSVIVDKILAKVGEENVGIRQTITVNAVDEKTNQQNVYHFINAGNNAHTISGIKMNVGELYNEKTHPTSLTTLSNEDKQIYNSTQLNSYISSLLINSIFKNLYPDPNFINPIYEFKNVIDFNPETNKTQTFLNKKIVKLANYSNDDKLHSNEQTNYGIVGFANKFKIVEKVDENNYNVKYFNKMPVDGMDFGTLNNFLKNNKLTIALKYIKTDGEGWVTSSKEFNNIKYIPIKYLSPKAELMQDILANGRIDALANAIEKYLLTSELLNKSFLTNEQILEITDILKIVLNKHNFASVFASGKLNQGIMPELIFDILYELSHHKKGNLLKLILDNMLNQALTSVEWNGSLEEQKQNLVIEVENLFTVLKEAINIDLGKFISPKTLVYSSKNPVFFSESLVELINSIDFKKLSEKARVFFEQTNNKAKLHPENKQPYIHKLSSGDVIKWVFESIDQKQFKNSIARLINNLDMRYIFDIRNSDSIIFKLVSQFVPSLSDGLEKIISKIDQNKDNEFINVKNGLINIINSIDFEILSAELNKYQVEKFIEYTDNYFDVETNKQVSKKHNIVLNQISAKNGILAFIKSLFYAPGSNRTFKNNLIEMFNLSSSVEVKTTQNGSKVFVPKSDNDKLSFLDFLSIFSGLNNSSSSTVFKNYIYEQLLLSIKDKISKSDKTINFDLLNNEETRFIKEFGIFNDKNTIQEALNKVDNLITFIKQTKGGSNSFVDPKNKTGADLLGDLIRFNDGNTTWQLLKQLISLNAGFDIQNDYSVSAQAFDIFTPWLQIFLNKDANQSETNKFVKDLLNFAISPSILQHMQTKSKGDNIPFVDNNDYYITDALSNPNNNTLFNTDENYNFLNKDVENLAKNNPKFRNWILNNKLLLINQLAMIASSHKFSANQKYPQGIYYAIVKQFVDNYLSKPEFYSIAPIAFNLTSKIVVNIPVEIFGINKILSNPILRFMFPEVALTYLASQRENESLINGNLAYLVLNRTVDFELLANENTNEFKLLSNYLDLALSDKDTSLIPLNLDKTKNLVMDGPAIENIKEKSFKIPKVFGINLLKIIPDILQNIVEPTELKEIVFNSSSSYVAKANYAYLIKNNKEIFNGEIPSDPLKIDDFINNLDEKYLLNVNGIKFVIVGQDITVDYMYPVVDENNLQVNTSNQALVYVNNSGFDRIKLAYAGNVVKEALLVKNSTQLSNNELKTQLTDIVDRSISDSNKLQRVFLSTEIDPINPERALRLNTVESIIKLISVATTALITGLSIVVGVAIIFVVKRYISNKNKVIGILVSQGYSVSQIALSLTIFALVTSIIGGVLGYVIGNRLQLTLLSVFSNYWTMPKETINFDLIAMIFTVFVPFISMSILIYIVALVSLRYKPVELMSNQVELPKSKTIHNYHKFTKRANVKSRFSTVLALGNIWKLIAFSTSVALTSSATIFGIATSNVFKTTVSDTYKNRNYSFKIDLESPTIEGGLYTTYQPENLYKNLYTPIGDSIESQRELNDFFKPGYSNVVNKNGLNGIKNDSDSYYDSHILTQFSASIKVDAGVSVDPWQVAYNSMPDSQKAKIDKDRDRVGVLLERTQIENTKNKWDINPITKYVSLKDEKGNNLDFFKYYRSPFEKQGKFVYAKWNGAEYEMRSVTTEQKMRELYRKFLLNGYKALQNRINLETKNPDLIKRPSTNSIEKPIQYNYWLEDAGELYGPTINDYFISFGGVYFNENHDEVYSYIKSNYKGKDIKVYGYKRDSNFVKLLNDKGQNLYESLYNFNNEQLNPLVINKVAADNYNLNLNDVIELEINNHIDRYHNEILKQIGEQPIKHKARFKIVGINPTYVNNEFITTIDAANKLIGLDKFSNGKNTPFNGILTNNSNPLQVTGSTGLYSRSGYWSSIDTFNTGAQSIETTKSMFDQIFNPKNGVLSRTLNQDQIMKFLDPTKDKFDENAYKSIREQPQQAISKFANIYENKVYIALSSAIDSKEIESGFIGQISNTIQTITISIIVLSFNVSLIILIIMSTIIISENQKNIAIWSILGYKNREKLKMFFLVYIPFIIAAILISIPISIAIMASFKAALLSFSGVALNLALKPIYVLLTTLIMLLIFFVTSFITWISVNKMKPVDLLKGK
ncbi:Uncharacterized ABC transporter permease MG468 homolog [Mycoplasmopsis bovigenitalium]|uniref:Uncharacterized ABC transporter permease MG468 homolog n=1 Tax=Mycoplasmopsis bovigenitalium TaxID=2112 RepID=A0A449A8A5_9BACT|nr:FtsX-like permease family protein [Mycoplasmopsis bovigenitalium]VEU60454.1 Uncharacterized ABC transporter permease MG468 homolog [Mycoplasmopsis bovigenitalium]